MPQILASLFLTLNQERLRALQACSSLVALEDETEAAISSPRGALQQSTAMLMMQNQGGKSTLLNASVGFGLQPGDVGSSHQGQISSSLGAAS